MQPKQVIVVGAGLAGLNCARVLAAAGAEVRVLEAADGPGGRVQTDRVDGFQLDRGFQVLQTTYPEARRALDYAALQLSAFEPGAIVRTERGEAHMVDPWRRPTAVFKTLFNHVGTVGDRLKLARLRASCAREGQPGHGAADCSIEQLLSERFGFSKDFTNRFLRPWISGMFFDESLESSANFFQFIFRMLATGDVALPSQGIGAITKQLADGLPRGSIQYGTPVASVTDGSVVAAAGVEYKADAVVLAVEAPQRAMIYPTGAHVAAEMVGTVCMYFASENPPPIGRSLVLNGELDSTTGAAVGPISNLCVPSHVCPSYAPAGQALISVSVRPSLVASRRYQDPAELSQLESEVREQATRWFGKRCDEWRLLKTYVIPQAVPRLSPGAWQVAKPESTGDTKPATAAMPVLCCGDYLTSPSLHGALLSGRVVAESILQRIN